VVEGILLEFSDGPSEETGPDEEEKVCHDDKKHGESCDGKNFGD
jgi:hypothetical protein